MQQCVPVFLVDYPIHIGSLLYQQLCDQKADFFVLEACRLLGQTEEGDREWSLVHQIGFVDLSFGKQEKPHDFIVAAHAGRGERSLFVVLGLQIDVDKSVFQQNFDDVLET